VSRGLTSLGLGLLLGLVGTEVLSGQQRYTFGVPALADGIDVVLLAVGLFAIGESLYVASRMRHGQVQVIPVTRGWRQWLGGKDLRRSWKPWLRGTAIGFPIGTIPAGGADVATFLSYATERRLAKGTARAEFGRGAIEGVAGPESANNAAAAGVLVPLLTLGLPTTATAAIIISAFQSYGIRPGPLLFENQPGLVWALIASLYIGNVLLIVLNLPLVGMWVKVLQIPRPYLYAGILAFAGLGAYALRFNSVDILILLVIGVVGFLMRRYGYPVSPMVVGGILGPMAEEQLRKAMAISQGDILYLVHSPFAIIAYSALAVIIATGIWLKRRKARIEASPKLVPTSAISAIEEPERGKR
jgi:putative tricarboxylic transport membrane protein